MPRDIEEGNVAADDGNKEEEEGHWWQERTLVTRVLQGVAIACAVVNVVNMGLHPSAIVILAAIFATALSTAVFYFQLILQDMNSLRNVQNQLRSEVNRMSAENSELAQNNNRLATQVAGLKQEELKLEAITKEQGSNVNELVDLVKTNRKTLDGLKQCVKAKTEQTFLSAVLSSDWNQDGEFSDQDLQMLEFRLKGVPGVKINHSVLVKRIKETDRSLDEVLKLLKEMDDDSLKADERIFVIEDDMSHLVAQ